MVTSNAVVAKAEADAAQTFVTQEVWNKFNKRRKNKIDRTVILEKVVAKRLSSFKTSESLYEPFQSVYRAGHSTETSVVQVQNDILEAIDSGKMCLSRTP